MLKTSAVLAALGFLVSMIASLFAGASWLSLLWRPLLFASFMAFLGAAIFFLLKSKVPEVIEEFDGTAPLTEEDGLGLTTSDLADTAIADDETGANYYDGSDSGSADEFDPKSPGAGNRKGSAGPGELLVEGVRIKNQPEVMADAIKHLMDQDKD